MNINRAILQVHISKCSLHTSRHNIANQQWRRWLLHKTHFTSTLHTHFTHFFHFPFTVLQWYLDTFSFSNRGWGWVYNINWYSRLYGLCQVFKEFDFTVNQSSPWMCDHYQYRIKELHENTSYPKLFYHCHFYYSS